MIGLPWSTVVFLTTWKPRQRILADRGFTARDLFIRGLDHSFFLRSTGKLSGKEAIQMRKIASIRIRVVDAIKRVQDYKIFKYAQPNCVNK